MRRALWILAVLLSHWRRHKMQLATLLIGLVSATALWSGVQALNQQARESYDRAAAVFGGTRTAALTARNFYKSMTTHADHRVWQDVYHAQTPAGVEAYIKITMRDLAPVIQFKRR